MLHVLPDCRNPADSSGKNSWVQHTLCLCFYSSRSLSLCHSPPTVVFAPIVTTQQPALAPSDWCISCEGGGLSARALSALKQISFPIHIPSTAEERAGAAPARRNPKAKTFYSWMSSFLISYKIRETRSRKGLKYPPSHCFLSLLLLFPPSCSLFWTSRTSNSTEETDYHHKTASKGIVGIIWRKTKITTRLL